MAIPDTLRGDTSPNRVTWSLLGVEGVLAFGVENPTTRGTRGVDDLDARPRAVRGGRRVISKPHGVWKLGAFDTVCGAVSVGGLIFWAFVNEPTVALVSFVVADQMAALPRFESRGSRHGRSRRGSSSWIDELRDHVTDAHESHHGRVLFPGCILVADLILGLLIVSNVGRGCAAKPTA